MHRAHGREAVEEPREPEPRAARVHARAAPARVLALQRGAGNAAVSRVLAERRGRILARKPPTRLTGETYTDTTAELFAPSLDNYGEFTGKEFRKEEKRTRKQLAKDRHVKEKKVPPEDVRIAMLLPRLQQAEDRRAAASQGGHNVLGVFLGPEWYFKRAPEPYTVGQRDAIVDKLEAISGGYPKLLIVPGSIVWRDADAGEMGNSAPVLYGGARVKVHHKSANYGDTAGYQDRGEALDQADEEHMLAQHLRPGARAYNNPVKRANVEYGKFRSKHFDDTSFFQIDNIRFSLEICGDHGTAIQEIANKAPFGPGEGAHVQLLMAHGAGVKANALTTPSGGHTYYSDADARKGDEYGLTGVHRGGDYPNWFGGRGKQQIHGTNPNTVRPGGDRDLMHGGVHPLPGSTALPVQPQRPPPPKQDTDQGDSDSESTSTTSVDPSALGLPQDLTKSLS